MPTGLVVVSQYSAEPPVQIDPTSEFEVRGIYTRDFIAGDGVTPVYGNDTSGNEGPYYDVDSTLNASGNLVVPTHEIQATTLSNPTANYFEGLWVDGAFVRWLMPNTNVATGWAIPTVYGTPIAIDEIALYNRAKRLLYPPSTYPTFDDVVLLIQRLAGNFDYMAVDVNGIGSASFPPVVASDPIVLMENDPKVGSWTNILSYFADTGSSAAANAVAITNAVAAAAIAGRALYIPAGTFPTNSVTISVPCIYAPGGILQPANSRAITHTSTVIADPTQHFDISLGGSVSLTGLDDVYPQWFGAPTDGSDGSTELAAMVAALPSTGSTVRLTSGASFSFETQLIVATSNITWSGYGATLLYTGGMTSRLMALSGDNNTFLGIAFSNNNEQPYGALIYVVDNTENPQFIDCKFKDLFANTHGSNVINQNCALAISPYGVTDFLFQNCLFYNLTSLNTAAVIGAVGPAAGIGFISGINFNNFTGTGTANPVDWGSGSTAQTVITNGLVEGCTFDTIKTILPAGLSDADVLQYDDGDGIRSGGTGVGYNGTGVNQINLRVANCRFTNVSKRTVKFSGVSGLTMGGDNEVIADQGAYSMSEVVKLYGNSIVDGLKIRTPGIVVSSLTHGAIALGAATATVVTSIAHGFTTNDLIAIIGATQPEYNMRVAINVINPTTFTYTMPVGSVNPTSPATGTIRATRSPRKGFSLETIQNTIISNIVMESGGFFINFNDTTNPSPAQRNLNINNFACDNLDEGGIFNGTNFAASAYGLKISNGYLGCTNNNSAGIVTPLAASGSVSEFEIYNIKVRNGDVKIGTGNNIIDGLTIIIDRGAFDGSVATRSTLDIGSNSVTPNYLIVRNTHVNITSILPAYLDGTRPSLITIAGPNTITQDLSLHAPPAADLNAITKPHIDFYGNDCVVDGVSYYGPGYIQLGATLASDSSVYRNLARLQNGTDAAGATFFLLNDASATNYVVQNVADFRTTTGPTFTLVGTPYVLDGVASISTQFETGGNDSTGSIINSYRIAATPPTAAAPILRRETTVTATNGSSFEVRADTVFLRTLTGALTNCTLEAASTNDLDLVIIFTGANTIGVIASTTAVFIGAAPTFGAGSTNIGSMTFRSASDGKWYETARAVVP